MATISEIRSALDQEWAAFLVEKNGNKWTQQGAWRRDNPGEWQKLQDFRAGGTRPALGSAIGKQMVEHVDAWLLTAGPVVDPDPEPSDGWRNALNTDFAVDGVLPAPWQHYGPWANGGSLNAGYYLPSHVVVAGGICKLVQKYETSGPARGGPYGTTGAGWYQGTIYTNDPAVVSTDHRTTVRLRIVSTNGVSSHRNLPLWWQQPDDYWQHGMAGGEEDFFETDGTWWPPGSEGCPAGMSKPRSFFHYSADNVVVYKIWSCIDLSQWHTYEFTRRDHKVTVRVDGAPVYEQQYSATELPDHTKKPVFQQENPAYMPPAGTTGSEEIQIESIVIDVVA